MVNHYTRYDDIVIEKCDTLGLWYIVGWYKKDNKGYRNGDTLEKFVSEFEANKRLQEIKESLIVDQTV